MESETISTLIDASTSFTISIISGIIAIGSLVFNFFQNQKIERLKGAIEKDVNVHKAQFEKEFEILSILWSKLIYFEECALRLTFSEVVDHTAYSEMTTEKVEAAASDLVKYSEEHSPFYCEEIHGLLEDITVDVSGIVKSLEEGKKDEVLNEKVVEFENKIKPISSAIRKRIAEMRVA